MPLPGLLTHVPAVADTPPGDWQLLADEVLAEEPLDSVPPEEAEEEEEWRRRRRECEENGRVGRKPRPSGKGWQQRH